MRVLVVGDSHGNSAWMHDVVIPRAVEMGATKLLQVGDFGFIWPSPNYLRTLDKLDRALSRAGLDLHFLPGNHEDFSKIALLASRQHAVSPEGHVPFRPHIFYTGRVSAWSWNGRRCAVVGCATSVDRHLRISGRSWWPEEALTPADVTAARALRRTEILFTHDCPVQNPFSLLPDADSLAHRQTVTDIARELRPSVWFHGHYHHFANYPFQHDAGVCDVTGLDRDTSAPELGTAVLDLASPR